jgi:hypothetical protein
VALGLVKEIGLVQAQGAEVPAPPSSPDTVPTADLATSSIAPFLETLEYPQTIFDQHPELLDIGVRELLIHWLSLPRLPLNDRAKYILKAVTFRHPSAVIPDEGIKQPENLFRLGVIPPEARELVRQHAFMLLGYIRALADQVMNEFLRKSIQADIAISYSLLEALARPSGQKIVRELLAQAEKQLSAPPIPVVSFKEKAQQKIAEERAAELKELGSRTLLPKKKNTPAPPLNIEKVSSSEYAADMLFEALGRIPDLLENCQKKKKTRNEIRLREGERPAQFILRYLRLLQKKNKKVDLIVDMVKGIEVTQVDTGVKNDKDQAIFEDVMIIGFHEVEWSQMIPSLEKLLSASVVDMKVDQIWQALLQLSPHWGLVEMVQQDAKTRSDVKDHRKRVLTRICNLVMKVIEAYKVEDARNQAGLSWSDHRNPVERMAILNLIDVRQKRIVRVVLDDQTPRPEKSAAVPNS